MKKVLKKEDNLHVLAGLIFVASGIVLVFVFLFNIYNSESPTVLYPPEISQITYIPNPPETLPLTTKAYQNYSATHTWQAIVPKTMWEKNDFPSFSMGDQKCYLATAVVFLNVVNGKYKVIHVNYPLCPNNSPMFYPSTEPNMIYASWNSENGGPQTSGSPAIRYWDLGKDESPENFIANLMKSLPTEMQRNHCKLDSKGASNLKNPNSTYQHYTISPDSTYIKALAAEGRESYGACYPYSNYFQVVGNTLFYIYNGQDASLFDPDSIKVTVSSYSPIEN